MTKQKTKHTKEYKAGYDAGLNKPNVVNCDFRFFATKEQTKEWEKGNREAKKLTILNKGRKE